jgi:hypothetical protein
MATSVTKHSITANLKKQSNSRLAQKIVENYIDKTKMSFSVLQKVWFDELQGANGVIKNLNDIDKGNEQNYYIDSPITLSDGTKIVICNQWEEKNFSNFILHARQLGVEIKADDFQVEYVTNYSKKLKSKSSNLL